MGKKPVLGKGIGALIPGYTDGPPGSEVGTRVVELPVEEIEPNPVQPRTDFNEERLEELTNSIREHGVIQPIIVNRVGQGYHIVAGERRWRASQKAGRTTIPAIVREVSSEQELMELSLIENIQRDDLNPIEEAEAYRALMEKCLLTQDDVAQKVGKDRSTVANMVRLLRLPFEIQDYLRQGSLQMGHARALLAMDSDEARLLLARRAVADKLSVRDVERAAGGGRKAAEKKRPADAGAARDPHLDNFEERLRHRFGTSVAIHRGRDLSGRIEVQFYSDQDLERILDLLLTDGT
jgi:ParB family chromosome partitioning protein